MKEVIRSILGGNAFVIATGATLATIQDVRDRLISLLLERPLEISASAILIEAGLIIGSIALAKGDHKKGSKSVENSDDPFFSEAFEQVRVRFSVPEDYEGLLRVFSEYFPPETALPAEEYRLLMGTGRGIVRIIEGVCADGKRLVIGYYSIWPLSSQTLKDLTTGALKEADLNASKVLNFDDPNAETLYIGEIAISRGQPFGQTLMRDAKSYVLYRAAQHSNMRSVSAWGYSAIGKKLASRMGMQRLADKKGRPTDFFEANIQSVRTALQSEASRNQIGDIPEFQEIKTIDV